jgi:NAD(P)-dependent dehydrogenase (short-subunit alcohol dehydrogenase family)
MVRTVGLAAPLAEVVPPAVERQSDLEVLVAGAGEPTIGAFLELSQDEWETAVAGAKRAFLAARDTARSLIERGEAGRIVLVSSSASLRPVAGATLAATAGAFLTTLAQVAAVELGPANVTVNIVAPGFIGDERFGAATPLGRTPAPEDVAEVCAFLASERAACITGAVVAVDGGLSITKSPGGSPLLATSE